MFRQVENILTKTDTNQGTPTARQKYSNKHPHLQNIQTHRQQINTDYNRQVHSNKITQIQKKTF